MQDRHDRDFAESVMLGPAFPTSWGMENMHDKSAFFQTQTFLHLILHKRRRIERRNARRVVEELED